MSEELMIIVKGEPREPEVAVVMHNRGSIIPLTPKHFKVFNSEEEAISTARVWIKLNATFANKWRGWKIATMRVDHQFEI